MMIKNNAPLVSIIMNCHNGQKYLKKSLNSVLSQSYNNFELIFFNNCSTDKSEFLFKSYRDKRFKYFESKKTLGLYDARNKAIKKAKGNFICFLDTDDWWNKNKLSKQLNLINSNKKIKIIYSNIYLYYNNSKKKKLFSKKKLPTGKITQKLLNDYKLSIASIMLSRSFFLKKKFNKQYNIIGDMDYFIKLSLKENFFCIQEPLAYYRIHKNNFSFKNLKVYFKEIQHWLKINSNFFSKNNLSVKKIENLKFKLKVKLVLRTLLNNSLGV